MNSEMDLTSNFGPGPTRRSEKVWHVLKTQTVEVGPNTPPKINLGVSTIYSYCIIILTTLME